MDEQRPVVDLSGSQIGGDVRSRDTTGRDHVELHGADPALLARSLGEALSEMQTFLRDYTFSIDQARETALKEFAHELRGMRGETDVIRDSVQKIQSRLNTLAGDSERDQVERRGRQQHLDRQLEAIHRWLIALTTAGGIAIVLLLLAYIYRLPPFDVPATLLRLWLGASLAIVALLRRVL